MLVRLVLVRRRFDEEDKRHEAVIILRDEDLLKVARVRVAAQRHYGALLNPRVLIHVSVNHQLGLVHREESALCQGSRLQL